MAVLKPDYPFRQNVPLNNGLVAAWLMPQSSAAGTVLYDYSGYGNNGAISGNAPFVSSPYGPALSFNGSTQYVIVPFNTAFQAPTNFTLCGRFNTSVSNDGNFHILVGQSTVGAGSTGTYKAYINGTGQLTLYNTVASNFAVTSATVIVVNKWYHWAITYDGVNAKIFINGILDATAAYSTSFGSNTDPIVIGRVNPSFTQTFTGLIAETRILNKTKSLSEIVALYQGAYNEFRPPSRPWLWALSKGGGGNIYNVSIAEVLSAADVLSNLAILPSALAESVTANDNVSDAATLPSSIAESISASDTISNISILPSSLNENVSTSDTASDTAIFPSVLGEIAAITDTISSNATLPSALVESGTAADVISETLIVSATLQEFLAATDSISSIATLVSAISEATTAADFISSIATLNALIAEFGFALDIVSSSTPDAPLVPTFRFGRLVAYLRYGNVLAGIQYGATMPKNGTMPFVSNLPAVAHGQVQTMFIDFGAFLPTGVTLTGTPNLTLSQAAGSAAPDPVAASRVSSGPVIGTVSPELGGSGSANTAVLWQVSNCVGGTLYLVQLTCARSDGSDVVEAWTRFPCQIPN